MPILAVHNLRIVVIVVAGHAVMAYLGSSPVRVAGIAPSHSAVAAFVAAASAVVGGGGFRGGGGRRSDIRLKH